MPHRHIIRAALAVGLAATALAAPAHTATATAPEPSAVEADRAGVPAVALLTGAAPAGATELPAAALASTACVTAPCPPQQPEWTAPATFAVVKQPHPSVDQHATPAGGPSAPSLLLLGQLRPRSALPTGRTTRLDPRPA